MGGDMSADHCETTILYIDDDEALGIFLRKNLARQGFKVINAIDRKSGLARLAEGGIDVIALDHYLLGETGLDILPIIADMPDHPPVVYVTGSGDASIAVEALKRGADDYVTKSISTDFVDLFVAALNQALERARLRRETEAAHEAMRQARDRAELLLREVNHRVANSLSLVASLVRLQTSLIADQAAVSALQETQIRIHAIGNVHRHLYANNQVGMVDLDDYLKSLLDELQSSMGDEARPHDIVLVSDPLQLTTDKVISLGLVVSELVTNAFKYAYPKGQAGEIRVRLSRRAGDMIELLVEDDGTGFDPNAPVKGTGLGTKILNAMASTMGGDLTYDRNSAAGTRACLTFPI
ncbi:response regulator [Rhizobium sp. LjRoot98]|uniref:sensor histidine kinase n=1 Tax=unclassified Rhizobium TaxID=2613769 RepID=UPI0007130A81|nr:MULTISPECIES: histidine kinase dimerization/phosphoacceptor domain -containing protein [unclassified Rhizobium]KQV34052.1 two-component system sensor histidine kinase/response regulator [Rhizobium sp. Root1204]KQY17651.1 two-component system sensor histidine kinase/response regulator [Rhizobium sp. Root1334]KRC13523.1 two-component system sensor histidine kinase/response regulator [Rhizobium sp. Root73]